MFLVYDLFIPSQSVSMQSWLVIFSKIPSHASIIKSQLESIMNSCISGSAITTFGLPPNLVNFASTSPKVHETDNLPGKTQRGPRMTWFFTVPSY